MEGNYPRMEKRSPLETLTKNNFVPVLKEALEVGVKGTNGFKTTGPCSWNSEGINYKMCG